jgi:hypothetical protein
VTRTGTPEVIAPTFGTEIFEPTIEQTGDESTE